MAEMTSDPQEIKEILQGLDSRDEGVRNSVARKIGASEDELVVSELVRRLCDDHPPIRRSALRTLQEVVPVHCDVVLPLLLSRTGAANVESRLQVLTALQHYGAGGEARVVKALLARLNDAEARVRAKALSCLASCAVQDQDQVVMKVLERLEDVEPSVRLAAAKALPSLASRQNHKVLSCLAQLCRNQRPPPHRENLREGACLAMTSWCSSGDAEGINLIAECIHQEHVQASTSALKALLSISRRGQHLSLEAAAKGLSHPEQEIRKLATEVLGQLVDPTEPKSQGSQLMEGTWSGGRIEDGKIFWADDSSSDYQMKGQSILVTQRPGPTLGTASTSSRCWARLLTPERLLWDSGDEWQRTAAVEAAPLPTLSLAAMTEDTPVERETEFLDIPQETSETWDPSYAMVAVASQFKAEDTAVRKSAVLAMPRVAGPDCDLAIELLLPMMQDESPDVRYATVNSLLQVAPKGHKDAIQAMTVRLEDQEVSQDCRGGYSVGVSAAKALKKMVTCREELVKIADELNFQGPSLRGF